jgi:hypothetical protein
MSPYTCASSGAPCWCACSFTAGPVAATTDPGGNELAGAVAGDDSTVVVCSTTPLAGTEYAEVNASVGGWDDGHARRAEHGWDVWVGTLADDTVAFSCGTVGRPGSAPRHVHDRGELQLCDEIARAAERLMAPARSGHGDCGAHPWIAWKSVATAGTPGVSAVTRDVLHEAFGGALFPRQVFDVVPLQTEIDSMRDEADEDGEDLGDELAAYEALLAHLATERQLRHVSYCRPIESDAHPVYPHLIVGSTPAGSLVGTCRVGDD